MHIDILRRLRDAVRRKIPKNGEPIVYFAFTTMMQLTSRVCLLARNNVQHWNNVQLWNIAHPDLATTDVYLFLGLKSALKGRHFVMLLIPLRMRRKS
jgi:hypothetical protein